MEPHPEDSAQISEPIDIAGVVGFPLVADQSKELLCKVVAVVSKGFIVFADPINTEFISYTVYFPEIEVSYADLYRLF